MSYLSYSLTSLLLLHSIYSQKRRADLGYSSRYGAAASIGSKLMGKIRKISFSCKDKLLYLVVFYQRLKLNNIKWHFQLWKPLLIGIALAEGRGNLMGKSFMNSKFHTQIYIFLLLSILLLFILCDKVTMCYLLI